VRWSNWNESEYDRRLEVQAGRTVVAISDEYGNEPEGPIAERLRAWEPNPKPAPYPGTPQSYHAALHAAIELRVTVHITATFQLGDRDTYAPGTSLADAVAADVSGLPAETLP